MTFNPTIKITAEQVNDLMITALEGGSTYWCAAVRATRKENGEIVNVRLKDEATWENFQPFHIRWFDAESDEQFGEPDENPEGWSDHIEITTKRVNQALSKRLAKGLDIENYDAYCADAWFQELILGEVVYG